MKKLFPTAVLAGLDRLAARTGLYAATGLAASALLLTACGSSSKHAALPAATEYHQETAAADYYEPEAGAARDMAAAKAAEISDSGAMSSENLKAENSPLKAGRKLIRTVNMEVETNDFDSLLTGINNKITELGGYVEQSEISGRRAGYQNEPYPRSAHITARVPADKLDSFITSVEDTGNVVNKSSSTEDVTLRYSDIESKKKSLTVEQERLWALLEKADTLEAVIALEQRLSDIRYELESMESQLRLYDNQVDYSTVTLGIREVLQYTPTAPETVGQRINRGFSNTVDSLSMFLVNLFVLFVSLSPVWIPAVVIAVAVILLVRRRTKRHKKNAPANPGNSAAQTWNHAGNQGNNIGNPGDSAGKPADSARKPADSAGKPDDN